MEIRRVQPDQTADVEALTQISYEAELVDNPYPTPRVFEEHRESLRNTDPLNHLEAFLGFVDGRAAVVGFLERPTQDNLEKAWGLVQVAPADRRRGHGTRMAEFLIALARDWGRSTLMTEVDFPLGADETHPDRRFAAAHGFAFSQADIHRVLELPVDGALLDRLAADAAPAHCDYQLGDFVGLPPTEILADYSNLSSDILVDAPSGELEFEKGSDTPATLAARVESLNAQGRVLYTTIAFDRGGVPVAHSQLIVPAHDPRNIFQWDTLVRRDHRGHRLGIATKVRNLRIVQALHPDRTILHTWNAESNAPMIAVNDAMGFVPVGRIGEYFRTL